jgi:hypothetical protein
VGQFNTTNTFSNGDLVDAPALNNIIDQATALDGVITDQTSVATVDPTADLVLVWDSSAGTAVKLRKALVSALPSGVTSVALTATPTSVFGPPGPAITGSGTLAVSLDNQAPNKILAGPVSGAAVTPTFRLLTPADLPSAVVIAIAALDVDWSLGSVFTKTLPDGAGNTPFTFSNVANGQTIKVRLQQGTGLRTVSWPVGTLWRGTGPAPVMTPGANARDIFTFIRIAGSTFGYADQNFTV